MGWFVLLSIGPLLFTNTLGYRRSREIIYRQVESDLTGLADVQAQHIGHRLEHGTLALKAIAAGNYFLAAGANRVASRRAGEMESVADSATIFWYLDEKLRDLREFESIGLYTTSGRLVAAVGTVQELEPPRSGEGEAGGGTIRWVRTPGQDPTAPPGLSFFAWITGPANDRVAYLAAVVKGTDPADFLQIPSTIGSRALVTILDAEQRPLFTSARRSATDYSEPIRVPPVLGAPRFHANYAREGGGEFLGVTAAIPRSPWRLLVEVPASEGLGALRTLRNVSFALEGMFIVFLFIAASLVAHDIVYPIRQLVDATRRIAGGDLTVRVAPVRGDEVGELGQAFNDMAGNLAASNARVHELHQREIERAAQLASVGELASGVAHEIKNPVAAIASGLDLVRRHVRGDAAIEDVVEEMGEQTRRIGQTIQDLLQFARPSTPSFAPVAVPQVLEHSARLVRPTAQQHGVTLALDGSAGAPRVLADAGMLQQALVNLLMNAIAATPPGGMVSVASAVDGDQVVITVRDTGHGIAEEDLDNVLKPFFTTRHRGTGLGLPITRTIVEHHHGRLAIASREGSGTTVRISLPVARDAESAA